MTLPAVDTIVSYPSGALVSSSTVLHVEQLPDGTAAVLLDSTACHPVDAAWPDQGPDRAVLEHGGGEEPILDCVVGGTDGERLYLGSELPVRKGAQGWAFIAAHIVDGARAPREGESVVVRVDGGHRTAVSAGHTACHLASLALNGALAGRWKKETPADALGSPNFDAMAIDRSLIGEYGSVDTYRLGRSLRRKGFITEDFDPAVLQQGVDLTLSGWVASGAAIRIEREGEALTDRRYWQCALPQGAVSIPCGGTHADSLGAFESVHVELTLSDDAGTPVLRMETKAVPAR